MLVEPAAQGPDESAGATVTVAVRGTVTEAEAAGALALARAAEEADGVGPLSEDAQLHLRYGGAAEAANVFARAGTDLAGYAQLGPPQPSGERSGELVVHPAHRRRGLGRALVDTVTEQAAGAPVLVWAHGDLPAAARLAAAAGFVRARALWQMSRPLSGALPEARLPEGMTVREFQPGRDDERWLALNARAFASHPEQGRWTADDLVRRMREDWFDPAGFFLAEREGELAGFHWTKVHRQPGGGVGEVYVLGTDPAARGAGLATALTLIGLRHLQERGAAEVTLYVDESNTPAIRLYTSLGFARAGVDVMYRHG